MRKTDWVIALTLMVPVAANAGLASTDGGLGVYDNVNNITWTSDANLFGTQYANTGGAVVSTIINDWAGHTFADGHALTSADFSAGATTWYGAQAWINYLNVTKYGGSNRWALPTTVDAVASSGYPSGSAAASSQLAGLFYGNLGGSASPTGGFTGTLNGSAALFSNIRTSVYWSGTLSSGTSDPWYFDTNFGNQLSGLPPASQQFFALAVSPGQVNAVPLPASAWLFLGGLAGLGAFGRRRRAT